jgi:hypothetical protein
MDNKKILYLLQDALEEEIPSAQIKLWSAVKASLVAGKHPFFQQGEKMNLTKLRRNSRIALATLIIITLLGIAFITPPGRAFAQKLFQFFVPVQETAFPLPPQPSPMASADGTVTSQSNPTGYASYRTIAEAQSVVDFTIYQLPEDPKGFALSGVDVQHDMGIVYIHYNAIGGGGELMIIESLSGFPQSPWSEVPPDAIEKVTIYGMSGEYVQGMFVVYPGATSATTALERRNLLVFDREKWRCLSNRMA